MENDAGPLLDKIAEVLTRGDFTALAALEETLRARMAAGGISGAALARKAERVTALLEAARQGLRAAQRRLAEIRAADNGVATYDGQGRRQEISTAASTMHRRF